MLEVFLVIGAFCLGVVLGERETRRKFNGWRPYRRTDVMSEWRDG